MIGKRVRALRKQKKLSQADVEKRTGLPRCHISRIENGHTAPSLQTLQKLAYGLEIPLYEFFHDGPEPPEPPSYSSGNIEERTSVKTSPKDEAFLGKLRPLIRGMDDLNRQLFLDLARKMAKR